MKVSIIGTGRIGFSLEKDPLRYKPCTHIGAIQDLITKKTPLEWSFICDLDKRKLDEAEKFIKKFNKNTNLKKATDYKDALAAKPDILIVSANTEVHYEIVQAAMKSGIRKIVLEKPVAVDKKHSMNILNLALKTGTHIWVNYERRYHPKYIKLKNIVQTQRPFGAPIYYRGWFSTGNDSLFKKDDHNEGALLHDTTHLVDLAQFLFGEIKKSEGSAGKGSKKELIHKLAFSHQDDIQGEIWTALNSQFFHFELEIMFEHGRILVGNGFYQEEKAHKSKYYKNFISLNKPQYFPDEKMKLKWNPFYCLYKNVVEDQYDDSFLKDACQNIKYIT